jgi:hypothetical protein
MHELLRGVSVPEHPLHFGPGTSITTPLWSKGLGFALSCSCILKYATSRGCGNVVIPQGFPKSVGRVESRLLGFPCFPYSVISMACFGNAFHKVTISAKARFGDRDDWSEMRTLRPQWKIPLWKSVKTGRVCYYEPALSGEQPCCAITLDQAVVECDVSPTPCHQLSTHDCRVDSTRALFGLLRTGNFGGNQRLL